MASKPPGFRPGCVCSLPELCLCAVWLVLCRAVPREARCCLAVRRTRGCKSSSSLQCGTAYPVPSLHACMCCVTQARRWQGMRYPRSGGLCRKLSCTEFCPGLKVSPSPCTCRDDILQWQGVHLGPWDPAAPSRSPFYSNCST